MGEPVLMSENQVRPQDARPAPSPGKPTPLASLLRSLHPQVRPLPGLLLALAAGIAAGRYEVLPFQPGSSFLALFAAVAVALHLALWKSTRFEGHKTLLSLIIFVILGLLSVQVQNPKLPYPPSLAPFFERPHTLYLAEVMHPPDMRRDRLSIPLRMHAALQANEAVPLEGGVLVSLPYPAKGEPIPVQGEFVLTRLTLKRFHNFNNPGGYDYVRAQGEKGLHARAHLRHMGWMVTVSPEKAMLLQRKNSANSFKSKANRMRMTYLEHLQAHVQGDTGSLYAALLLGYRNLTSKELQEAITSTGVAHLLAISGLHLGLVAMSVFWLSCRLLRILFPSLLARYADKHVALWVALAATAFYASISGMALPTWRALVFVIMLFFGTLWYRQRDFTTTLCAAAILILAVNPYSLWQPSFQLSFAAVAGIVWMAKASSPLRKRFEEIFPMARHPAFHPIKPFWLAFWVSLAANLSVLPILAYHFNGVSLMGFLSNTLLVPLVGMVALPIGLAALVSHLLFEPLGTVLLKLGAFVLDVSRQIILFCAGREWAFQYVGKVPLSWLLVYYTGLVLALLPLGAVRRLCAVLSLVMFGFVFGFIASSFKDPLPPRLETVIVDVGQGSSTFVQFPTGETMLVDGGGFWDDAFDVGRHVVAPFLWHRKVSHLDYVVLSHDHPDHKNGLKFILSTFSVGELWESGINANAKPVGDLEAIALRRNIPVRKLDEILGNHLIGEAEVRVVHPTRTYIQNLWDGRDLNNVSLVLQISYGDTSLILPGDIGQSEENLLPIKPGAHEQVLLVGAHHGSSTSSSEKWLRSLKPQAIIFSCGFQNLFGFPTQEVLDRCAALRIPVFRTDQHGAVEASSDGKNWTVRETLTSTLHDPLHLGLPSTILLR